MGNRGLLLTMTEPPGGMEEEFNAWYDDEHLAERLGIPGFRSARRWVADLPSGEGKYLATYELESPGVLESAEYLSRFQAQTPWSRRCLGKAVVFRRWACEQVEPGTADPHPRASALLLIAADEPVRLAVPGALQVRRFLASSGSPAHIELAELGGEERPSLGNVAPDVLVRHYRAYAR